MLVNKYPEILFGKVSITSIEFTVPHGTLIPPVSGDANFQITKKETTQGIHIKIQHIELGGDVFESFYKGNNLHEMELFKFIKAFSFPDNPENNEALFSAIAAIYLENKKIAGELEPLIKEIDSLKQARDKLLQQASHFTKNAANDWPVEAGKLLIRVKTLLSEMEKRLEEYQAQGQSDYVALAKKIYQSLDDMRQDCEKILNENYLTTAINEDLKALSEQMKGLQGAEHLLQRLSTPAKDVALIRHNTVMAVLAAVSALESPYLKQQFISELLKLPMIDYYTQVQRLCGSILDLKQVKLMSDFSVELLLNQRFIDKSCQSRINNEGFNFFGQASQNEYENKIMWSYYTQSVEKNIALQIAEGDSLASIFEWAAKTRQRIAKVRGEDYRFGEFRDNPSTDIYSSQGKSVANKQIFPTLVSAIGEQKTSYDSHESPQAKLTLSYEADVTPFSRQFKFSPTMNIGGQTLTFPDETMAVYYTTSEQDKIRSVAVQFKENNKPNFTETLNALDKHFLTRVREFKFKNDEEFLTALGEFTYAMAKSYPLTRGSGAVTQWLVRGIVLYYTKGLISLNDIRLGNAKDDERAPYDIYAQMVHDSKLYARDFKASLMPYFSVLAKSKELLQMGGYQEKEGEWILSDKKKAAIAKASNPYFLKKHDDLERLAKFLNSKEPLDMRQLNTLMNKLKEDSIQYQKDKHSFFQSKVAQKTDEVLIETAKFVQTKK